MVNFDHSLASKIDVDSFFNFFLFRGGYDVIKGNFATVQFIKREKKPLTSQAAGGPAGYI